MKATAPMCSAALSTLAAPGLTRPVERFFNRFGQFGLTQMGIGNLGLFGAQLQDVCPHRFFDEARQAPLAPDLHASSDRSPIARARPSAIPQRSLPDKDHHATLHSVHDSCPAFKQCCRH